MLGKLAASRGDARRLIEQGGVFLDGEKAEDVRLIVPEERLRAGVRIKKGKKGYMKFSL